MKCPAKAAVDFWSLRRGREGRVCHLCREEGCGNHTANHSPGSIIVSDQWRAYRDIPNLPGNYTHYTVNHSENFVDPVTGKHTNHVESYWMRMKSTFKRMNGTYKDFGPSYMDEFMNATARRRNLRTLTFSNTWLKCTLARRHEVYVYIKRSFSGPPLPMKEYELDHGCLMTRAVETHFKKPRFFRFLQKPKKSEKLGF